MTAVSTHRVGTVGTAVLGISASSPPVAVRKVVRVPDSAKSTKSNSDTSVNTAMKAGPRHLIGASTSAGASRWERVRSEERRVGKEGSARGAGGWEQLN